MGDISEFLDDPVTGMDMPAKPVPAKRAGNLGDAPDIPKCNQKLRVKIEAVKIPNEISGVITVRKVLDGAHGRI